MRIPLATLVLAAVVSAGIAADSASGHPPIANVAPAPCIGEAWPSVFVEQGSYSPAKLKLAAGHAMGGKVNWRWDSGTSNPVTASVTYDGRLALFDSGTKTSTTTAAKYSHTFAAAGTYRYHSKADASQKGSISVPMCNVPAKGRAGHSVWVQTSTKRLSQTAEDVQVKRPGSSHWKSLKHGFKGVEFSWTPTKAGTYRLRARLRRLSNNAASRYSPVSSIKVR